MKRPRIGRPPLDDADRRDVKTTIAFTALEAALIDDARSTCPVAIFVRDAAIDRALARTRSGRKGRS